MTAILGSSFVMGLRRLLGDRRFLVFAAALLLWTGSVFVGAVLAGRELLISGHVWPSDIIFGFDIERNIRDMSEPGHNGRSNVHPLFAPMAKPFALLIQKAGITRGMSAIILNAMAGGAGVLITAWYLRLRRAALLDIWLACALMTSSATFIFQSALPGTYIFSFCVIGLSNILLNWQLRRPDAETASSARGTREAFWLVTGVLNYGLTITNGFMSFMTYGLGREGRKGWARAVAYGAVVLGSGLLLTWLLGSSLNIAVERRWLSEGPIRGPALDHPFFHSFSTFMAWSFVAPRPSHAISFDERQWTAAILDRWNYDPAGWALVLVWIALLGSALWFLCAQRGALDRRLNLSLAASFLFHAIGHSFYYVSWEGVFVYSSHSMFLVIGAFAPMLAAMERFPAAARWAVRIAMLVLIACLLPRHFALLLGMQEFVPLPPGYAPK